MPIRIFPPASPPQSSPHYPAKTQIVLPVLFCDKIILPTTLKPCSSPCYRSVRQRCWRGAAAVTRNRSRSSIPSATICLPPILYIRFNVSRVGLAASNERLVLVLAFLWSKLRNTRRTGVLKRTLYLRAIQAILSRSPVCALLGPRQCGKTTLARQLAAKQPSHYFDLQTALGRARLSRPELVLTPLSGLSGHP